MSQLALSGSFEYPGLCYWSTAIINILILTVRGSTYSDVYRRQILTTKVDPRAVRVINDFIRVYLFKGILYADILTCKL